MSVATPATGRVNKWLGCGKGYAVVSSLPLLRLQYSALVPKSTTSTSGVSACPEDDTTGISVT